MKNKCHIGLKTWWEKEKLLVTSNFSFSHGAFHSYISLVRQNAALCGNGLNLYQTTNFKRLQSERVYRRQFRIWWKWQKVLKTSRKHLGKRRNYSLRAISPFPTVFSKRLVMQTRKNQGLFGKGLKKGYSPWLHSWTLCKIKSRDIMSLYDNFLFCCISLPCPLQKSDLGGMLTLIWHFWVLITWGQKLFENIAYIPLLTQWWKMLQENIVEKGEIAQEEQFHVVPQWFFYIICILKSFDSHISVVVCSFAEFGTVSKWYIGEWVK